jgi:alpha-beta hydrolase superfamily lysophospholipase
VATEAVPAILKGITAVMAKAAPLAPVFKIDENLISRDPAVVRDYQQDPLNHNGKLPARTLGEIMRSMSSMASQVAGLSTPLLLLHGSDDQLCPADGSRMVHEGATGVADKTLKVYDGLYHEIFNEPERDEVIGDLVAWLAERSERAERAPEAAVR